MAYLEKKDLAKTYEQDKRWSRQFHTNFPEYERLAENRLPDDLGDDEPPVNDGTLSALILEIAMRQFRQLQTGKVTCTGAPAYFTELVSIWWTKYLIPNANTQSSFFMKFFNGITSSDTYGSGWFHAFPVSREGYEGSDYTMVHIRDVAFETGKTSDQDCQRLWLDLYYTESQLESLIDEAEEEDKLAKKEKRESDNPYDVPLLKRLVEEHKGAPKDVQDQNDVERSESEQADYIKIVKLMQRGWLAPVYYFAPDLAESSEGETSSCDGCVGEDENRNPSGDMQLTAIYSLENLKNPYGKGLVEMGGHIQNILDSLVRDHILASSRGVRPPINLKGDTENVDYNSISWDSDIWETGEAEAQAVRLETSIYSQFPEVYGLYKVILMNILGISDMAVSSSSGDPQFSKTDRGVAAQQERTTIHDGFRAQNADNAFARLASNLINIAIANTEGSVIVELLDDEIEKLNLAGFVDENGQPLTSNQVEMDWERLRGADPEDPYVWRFEVDPNSSQNDDTDAVDQGILEVIKVFGSDPTLSQAMQASGYRLDTGALLKEYLVDKLRNPEKVIVPVTPESTAVGGDPSQAGGLQEIMQQFGVDEQTAQVIGSLRASGMTDEQIVQYFTQAQAGGEA